MPQTMEYIYLVFQNIDTLYIMKYPMFVSKNQYLGVALQFVRIFLYRFYQVANWIREDFRWERGSFKRTMQKRTSSNSRKRRIKFLIYFPKSNCNYAPNIYIYI